MSEKSAFRFKPGDIVEYPETLKTSRPEKWRGRLVFMEYTGTLDSCLIRPEDEPDNLGLHEFAGFLIEPPF